MSNHTKITTAKADAIQYAPSISYPVPQIREQMSGPDLHVFILKFLALKKTVFSPIKNTFQKFFDFCLPLFYATFQCRP
jgi:hypothetical protein